MKKLYLLLSFIPLSLGTYAQESTNPLLEKAVFKNTAPQQVHKQQASKSARMQQDFGNVPSVGHLSVFEGSWSSVVKKMATDANGNTYVAGEFSKEMTVQEFSLTDEARKTIFLAKLAPNESILWMKKLTTHTSGYSDTRVHDLEIMGDSVFISGEYSNGAIKIGQETLPEATGANGRPFIAGLTGDGNVGWRQSFPEINPDGNNVRGENDNIAIIGSSLLFRTDINKITTLDFRGNLLGTIQLPAYTIAIDMEALDGDLLIAGTVNGDTQFGSFFIPGGLYNRIFLLRYNLVTEEYVWVTSNNLGEGAEMAEGYIESVPVSVDVHNSEIYTTGQFTRGKQIEWSGHTLNGSTGTNRYSPFAAKFDANGNALWLSLLEGDGEYSSGSMALNGNYLIHNSKNKSFTLLDANGALLKNASLTGAYQEFVPAANGYLLGGLNDYGFTLEKADENLNGSTSLFSDQIKAGFNRFEGLELDSQGNLYHLATIGGKTTIFNTEFEGNGLVVAKTTADGEIIWSHLIQGANTSSFGKNIKVNQKDSSLFITGYAAEPTSILGSTFTPTESLNGFVAKVTLAGQLQWIQNMPLELNGVEVDSKNNVYLSGIYEAPFTLGAVSGSAPQGAGDAFLIKLDPSGSPQWGNFYAGDEYEYNGLVAISAQDEVYFSGEFYSRNITLPDGTTIALDETKGDILLSKLTTNGATEWTKVYGEGAQRWYGWPCSIEVTPEGNVAISGWVGKEATFDDIILTSPYQTNNFVATVRPDGTTQWANIIRTNFSPFNYNEMGVDKEGNIYVGGMLNGDFEFTADATGSTTGFYIAKYNAEGAFSYAKTINSSSSMQLGGFAVSNNDDLFVNGFYSGKASFNGNTYPFLRYRRFPYKPEQCSCATSSYTGTG